MTGNFRSGPDPKTGPRSLKQNIAFIDSLRLKTVYVSREKRNVLRDKSAIKVGFS